MSPNRSDLTSAKGYICMYSAILTYWRTFGSSGLPLGFSTKFQGSDTQTSPSQREELLIWLRRMSVFDRVDNLSSMAKTQMLLHIDSQAWFAAIQIIRLCLGSKSLHAWCLPLSCFKLSEKMTRPHIWRSMALEHFLPLSGGKRELIFNWSLPGIKVVTNLFQLKFCSLYLDLAIKQSASLRSLAMAYHSGPLPRQIKHQMRRESAFHELLHPIHVHEDRRE